MPLALPAFPPALARVLGIGLAGSLALVGLVLATTLFMVRATHVDRIFPALTVADVPLGGMSFDSAAAALTRRAEEIEASPITLTYGDRVWTATLREVGVAVDENAAIAEAVGFGREDAALGRVRSVIALVGSGEQIALPMTVDYQWLDGWFDAIDADLGTPARDASLEIQGTNVVIVPEVDGEVVNRERARSEIVSRLRNLEPIATELPVTTRIASVRAVDLESARDLLQHAMLHSVQVTNGSGVWTLPPTELSQFLKQDVGRGPGGSPTFKLSLDRERLAAWLDERLGAEIATEPVDAVVGWNGERVVAVEPSVDGKTLDAAKLAESVEGRFFGDGGAVEAPVTYIKPNVDSGNLDALGITTFLGSGQSNYSGSSDGRATNVEVGAALLNGTLIPPWSDFSLNGAIGAITEDKGFVEAQVIADESIGKDIGGGICQVSTTVFRAAYLAGLPIVEWWPHRFRIGFYEYDGWKPGLDASILQPSDDPSTWADFKFENPSGSWMLVESWTDGVNVVVNIYGADLGYQVETTGPTWGDKAQMLRPSEVVDDELDPGTVILSQSAGIGEELSHYRVVRDRDGNVLWERSFYTKYFPRGDVWKVSPDMKGQAPIDPTVKFPPLPPAGIDSHGWVPSDADWFAAEQQWTPPAEAPAPAAAEWVPSAEASVPASEEWVPPDGSAAFG